MIGLARTALPKTAAGFTAVLLVGSVAASLANSTVAKHQPGYTTASVRHVEQATTSLRSHARSTPTIRMVEYMLDSSPREHGTAVTARTAEYMLDVAPSGGQQAAQGGAGVPA